MRTLLTTAFILGLAAHAFADIQDPPSNNYGPTRKLGRGLSNLFLGIAELPVTIGQVNKVEGGSAAAGYGVLRGLGRSGMRMGSGLFEVVTFPFPIHRNSYYPLLPSDGLNVHGGYPEFPPELGNESKYPYVRIY